jgi:PKD repeat protein
MKTKRLWLFFDKKIFALLIFLIFLCNSIWASPVDTLLAKTIAKNFYYEMASSKSAVDYTSLQLSLAQTRIENTDTIYYVFNSNTGGWVIVSAIDNVVPILAFSLEGSYKSSNQSPAMIEWMANYKNQILYAKQNSIAQDSSVTRKWIKYSDQSSTKQINSILSVGPLLTSTWNQSSVRGYPNDPYYNLYCPVDYNDNTGHAITGCVATAMGQIMRYWGYNLESDFPTQGLGLHTDNDSNTIANYDSLTANFCNTAYAWSNMPDSLYGGSTTVQIDAVATLLYHCGISVDMNYGPGTCFQCTGSEAYPNSIPIALINYFGYSNSAICYAKSPYEISHGTGSWKYLLVSELDANRPMEYHGWKPSGGGHSFVCDGYITINFFHFNWGWGGDDNGNYYIETLSPLISYSVNQGAVIGIQPGGYISMYSDFSTTPDPIIQGQPLTVTVDLSNYGADNFNGDIFLGLYDMSYGFVQQIDQISNASQSPMTYGTYQFDCSNITAAPGNYYLYLFYQKSGSICWIQAPHAPFYSYSNPQAVQVISAPLIANFTANTTLICSGNTVFFTDLSIGSPTSWSWNFGDGFTSISQNPSHIYTLPGPYTVSLTVTKGASNDTEIKTNYISVQVLPSTAATPTGVTTICQDSPNTNYSTTGATYATSYSWNISPSGAGTISGAGTTGTVDWNSSFIGTATIKVRGGNSCGNGAWSNTLTINVNPLPSIATAITGTSVLCQNASNTNYSTTGAIYATSYLWSISPSGAGTISGIGTTGTVDWDIGYTGTVTIGVYGVNSCGNSPAISTITVNINPLPSLAAIPTGIITMCQNPPNSNYTTTGSSNATSYVWSINPPGAGSIPGTGTTSTVNWNNSYTGTANISVHGVNSCGNGTESAPLTVTINAPPAQPTISANGNQLTSSATSGNQWYHNGSIINGATSQVYIALQNGTYYVVATSVYGCSSTSDPFNYYISPALPYSPELLTTSGNFDTSGISTLSWSIGECMIETYTGTNNILTQGFHQTDYLITEIDEVNDPDYSINIFPNPAKENLTIEIITSDPEILTLYFSDEIGKILIRENMKSEERLRTINLQGISTGIYFLSIVSESGKIIKSYKVQKIN